MPLAQHLLASFLITPILLLSFANSFHTYPPHLARDPHEHIALAAHHSRRAFDCATQRRLRVLPAATASTCTHTASKPSLLIKHSSYGSPHTSCSYVSLYASTIFPRILP